MTLVLSRLSEASTTVQTDPARSTVGIRLEAELGGDHHLITKRSQRFADQLFVSERTVDLGGVKECNATFDGRPDQRDHLLCVSRGTETETHSHAAEPMA